MRELSLTRLCASLAVLCVASVILFTLLVIPAIFQSDELVQELSKTTSLTLDASLEQTAPTYIVRNPDILVTTGDETGFITVTPSALTVRSFVFFGERSYSWLALADLATVPAEKILVPITLFVLPSIIVWGTLLVLGNLALATILYAAIAGIILHARGFVTSTSELAKVALIASVPSLCLGAAIPILRLGLPLAVILGFLFSLWLTLALLGTTHLVEKRAATKFSARR